MGTSAVTTVVKIVYLPNDPSIAPFHPFCCPFYKHSKELEIAGQ
jgi:hypothetical protein